MGPIFCDSVKIDTDMKPIVPTQNNKVTPPLPDPKTVSMMLALVRMTS